MADDEVPYELKTVKAIRRSRADLSDQLPDLTGSTIPFRPIRKGQTCPGVAMG